MVREIIVIHESYISSLAKCLTTFVVLISMFWINQELLDSAIPDFILGAMFFIYLFLKLMSFTQTVFIDRNSAVAFINSFYGGRND